MLNISYPHGETSVQANADLSSLRSDVRAFVNAYPHNNRQVIDSLVQHLALESKRVELAMASHVDGAVAKLDQSADQRLAVLLKSQADERNQAQDAADKARLLDSLSFQGMNERFNQIAETHAKTSEWVLRDSAKGEEDKSGITPERKWDSFPDWLESKSTVYWVSGKPGAGKSTLIKYMVRRAETQQRLNEWMPDTLIISHFLFRPGSKLQHSLEGLLLPLVRQLIQKGKTGCELARQLIQDPARKSHNTDWSVSELETLLLDILRRRPQSTAIFIDGLDEVLPESDLTQLIKILGSLEEFANSTGKLKLCLSSRPEPLLLQTLSRHPSLQLERLNKVDLRRYAVANLSIPPDNQIFLVRSIKIGGKMCRRENLPSHEELATWLVEMLVEKADGIFLWLYLTVNTVSRALQLDESIEDLEHRIDHMPRELPALFKDMWERVNGDSKEQKARGGFYVRLVLDIASSRHW